MGILQVILQAEFMQICPRLACKIDRFCGQKSMQFAGKNSRFAGEITRQTQSKLTVIAGRNTRTIAGKIPAIAHKLLATESNLLSHRG